MPKRLPRGGRPKGSLNKNTVQSQILMSHVYNHHLKTLQGRVLNEKNLIDFIVRMAPFNLLTANALNGLDGNKGPDIHTMDL
jgi:hypothetical protein